MMSVPPPPPVSDIVAIKEIFLSKTRLTLKYTFSLTTWWSMSLLHIFSDVDNYFDGPHVGVRLWLRGPLCLQNAELSFVFLQTGFHSSDREQFSRIFLKDLAVNLLIFEDVGGNGKGHDYWVHLSNGRCCTLQPLLYIYTAVQYSNILCGYTNVWLILCRILLWYTYSKEIRTPSINGARIVAIYYSV